MTIVEACSRLFDLFAFHRRSNVEQQNTPARPTNLGGDRLSVALCFGAIAIGIIALIGYILGNTSIASLGAGKPVAALTAFAFILLGAGLLALRLPAPAGLLAARSAALGVVAIAAVDLLADGFSWHIEEWQVWVASGGVYFHPFPVTGFLLLASGSALVFITTRRNFAGHVIASAVLAICGVFLVAYVLKVPSFLDSSRRIAPVAATALGLVLISIAEVLARPRGWIVPLFSRTPAGTMSRLLLPVVFVVPFLALALHDLIAGTRWFTPEVGLTVIVAVNVFFSAAVVLGTGVILQKRERDRVRLTSIVDSSTDAIIGKSSGGLIDSWNTGAERMYGYTAAEAIGRSITMLVPPERHDEVPLLLERVQRGERVDPFETVRVTKDGRRIDVWLNVSPILDPEGNVAGASTISHDITDHKRSEEVIRRMAEQYSTILAMSSDGFWLLDLEGRLLDVNDAYCRMTGYSREELLKLHVPEIEASETPEETASHIRTVMESGFARFETKHRTKDNRVLDVEVSVSPWRAAGQLLVFARDVTERNRSEARYRTLVESLPQKICLKDRDLVWVSINENFACDLKIRPEEGVGKTDYDFFPRELADKHRADDARIIRTGITEDRDEEYVENGQRRFVHTVKTPVRDKQGNTTGILLIFWDITEKKLAEDRLEKAMADLERSNKELEQFAYVASHDLQEPLRMVSSYTQLLAERYRDKLDQDANDFIGFAVDGANRMQQLISDLLTYSRVGTKGKPLEAVDSHAAFGRAVANLRVSIDECGAMVTNDDLPAVLADEGQLVQLFQNLVFNGIKFRREGMPPRVHVSAVMESGEWVFSVKDNGIGIPAEFQPRLFVIFQRFHKRDQYPGTGLGLAICKRIVERHGGRIWVESEEGSGSTFRLTLPARTLKEAIDV
jgi:PAS domain S-box-containing protein